jgi:DHA1 family tetracycline resistance protein-like MFS transporter
MRRPFEWKRANPIGALVQIRRYPAVFGYMLAMIPFQVAHDANPAVWGFYTMHKFGWSVSEVGWSLFVVGATIMFVNAMLVGPAIARLGDKGAVYVGWGGMALGFSIFAFASEGWMVIAGIFPFALVGIAQPAMRGMMANLVPADAQGELQGAMSSVMSLTMIVSPVFMTELFYAFSREGAPIDFPGAPFLAASLLILVAAGLFTRAIR